jgi:hypothetical protein
MPLSNTYPLNTTLTFGTRPIPPTRARAGGDHRELSSYTVGATPVPEPATLLTLGTGLTGLLARRSRRRKIDS